MRRLGFMALLCAASFSAHALQSLRVGNQLLVVGDSGARVKALLGDPAAQSKISASKQSAGSKQDSSRKKTAKGPGKSKKHSNGKGKDSKKNGKGETWIYHRDGHTTVFTIVGGKIAHIDDAAR